ncbi:MAG: SH3 domain-containing protein [Chloroflexi bacterium]|nr:SH3 domain-containing protein [Chloroflexota bacterium]
MRRWHLLFVLGVLALAVSPVHAIPAEFTAWLYTPDTGEMTLVDLSGERDTFELPIAPPYTIRPLSNVGVSPNGRLIAYVLAQPDSTNQQLMIYDYNTRTVIAQYPVSSVAYNSIDFNPRFAFSPDSRRVALGYSVDPSGWELVVIDLDSFSIAGTLSSGDPAFAGIPATYGITPTVTYFRSPTELAIALIRGGTEASEPAGSYLWDTVTASVTPHIGYGSASDVFAPTGEAVMALPDDRFPMMPDRFMFGQFNTIQVYDAARGERWPVFQRSDWTIYGPKFVFNAQLVAFVAYDGTSERVYLLNRDGAIAGALPPGVNAYEMAGVPDGFIYAKPDGGVPGLYSINLRAGDSDGSRVWSGVPNTYPRIAWVGSLGSSSFMFLEPPYANWPVLADPIADASGPGPTEPGGLTLRVGERAIVRTTEGDALRVRSGPGTNFVVVRSIPPGSTVDLIGGPTSSGGFNWWNIRLDDGTTGWAVDFADGEQTLVPIGAEEAPPTLAPTATPGADPSVPTQLRVGDNALVTTGALRLRSVPGLGGALVREMPRDTYVRVIGGPTPIDNYLWWQLQLLDGTTGWAAEIVGTERVLTYTTQPPPTATPAPSVTPVGGPSPTPLIFVPLPITTPLIVVPLLVAPNQVSPADGHTFDIFPRTTTLSWSAVAAASGGYELQRQWCSSTGTNCSDYPLVSTGATSYTFDFIGAQVGRWRVRSVGSGGAKSDWSPWRTFRHLR